MTQDEDGGKKPKDKVVPVCPVAVALDLIGNKWRMSIIWQLLEKRQRFGELRRNIPGISQKVLTDNLRSLKDDGMITRTVYAEVPPRVEYELSEMGRSIEPILMNIEDWAIGYLKHHRRSFVTCRGITYRDGQIVS
jgi:DNA-binding HxlR family transcriptional regulator